MDAQDADDDLCWTEACEGIAKKMLQRSRYKAKTGVGCDGFHLKVPLGRDNGNERKNRGFLGKGGAEWKMAATSLYNGVLLDSEECHE